MIYIYIYRDRRWHKYPVAVYLRLVQNPEKHVSIVLPKVCLRQNWILANPPVAVHTSPA